MATSSKLKDDFLSCNVCMDVYLEPVTLECQHSFCKTCLRIYLHTKAEAVTNKSIPCPTCRQETPVPYPDRPVEEWVEQLKPGLTGLMASVVEDSTHCSMCQKEEKTTPATAWCEDCENGFCDECLKLHDKVPLCSSHTVSKLTERKQKRVKRPHICSVHEETIRLFCKDCKKSLCPVCCSIGHRLCEDVVMIKDVLPEVKSHLLKQQETLAEQAERRKAEIVKYDDELDKFLMKSALVKSEISTTVQAAVDHLREKEIELLEKLDVQTDQHTANVRSKVNTKQTETQMYQQQSQVIQLALELGDEAQLFEMYLSSCSGSDIEQEDVPITVDLSFTVDLEKVKESIQFMDVRCVGTTIDLKAKPVLYDFVVAKVDNDDSCDVRDAVTMMISDTQVTLFADLKTKKLKSFYQKNGQDCSSVLQVSGIPWCITIISEAKVAVSCYNVKHILTVAVTPDLELATTIQTRKKYWGLSTLDRSTLVAGSESPPSVDLIDMQGNILKTFSSIPVIGKSFTNPRYIHVTRQGTILVSDWGLKSVISLTLPGDIVFAYTPSGDRALKTPFGITSTNTGDILVADWDKHKVIHVSDSGEFSRDTLTAEDGLKFPFGLFLDEDKLCVTSRETGLHKFQFVNEEDTRATLNSK